MEGGTKMVRVASTLIWGLPLIALSFMGCMPYSTGPTEVGVRTVKLGILRSPGVEKRTYGPGATYWFMPIVNDWHTFDARIQVLEMTMEVGRGDREGRDDLLFKTIDGNDISLDVVISYRIDPDKAPHILEFVAKNDEELKESVIRTVTRSAPRDVFGELRTEQLYVAEERAKKAARARAVLNDILKPYGIIVESVMTKDYRFNPAYEKTIEERKVADQLAEKAKSETKAAEEEWRRRLQDAIGEVNQRVAKADGEYLKAKIEADAYYDQQEMLAKAIRAEAEAEARGLREMARAMTGKGGQTMIKMKLAEALQGKTILVLPVGGGGLDVKTTDINRLLEYYGLKTLTAPSEAPLESKP